MKIILTESQYNRILFENTNSDNKIIDELRKAINADINRFVTDNKVHLDKSSKILNANQIITQFKNYLMSQTPSLLQQMKMGKGGDVFAETAYKGLYSIIQSNLNDVGWAKKQLVKTIAPNKEKLLNQMMSKDVDNYFETFKRLLDLSFKIGWMDEVQPYSDNLEKWSRELYGWVDNRHKVIKDNFINLIVNSIYK
jgi:hypothetical protein